MSLSHSPLIKPQSPDKVFRFASIGECMVEMAPSQNLGEYKIGYAGDTFNTSWYLNALRPDVVTRYITRVGADDASKAMLSMMNVAGIDTSKIEQDARRTVGLYLISLKNGERSFSYWRDQSAARLLGQNYDWLSDAVKDVDLVYFSGITLAILDKPGRETLRKVLTHARQQGKTIAFDSNLRPGLWSDSYEMTSEIMKISEVCDIVLPSYDDEATFFNDTSIEATSERYLNCGAKTVIVKNGAGSVYYSHDGETAHVETQAAHQVVDTTSAGDSFNAGIFAGLDQVKSVKDLIKTASQVAGQVIGRKGALVDLDFDKLTIK